MKMTLNFEAPGRSTSELTQILQDYFAPVLSRIRVQKSSYDGPDGAVETRTIIAEVVTPLNMTAAIETLFALSCKLEQDCIAVRFPVPFAMAAHQPVDQLIGPRADKWLPFNPEFFVEY